MRKIVSALTVLFFNLLFLHASSGVPQFSTAGFFKMDNSGRDVYSMNPAWRFYKGEIDKNNAQSIDFDDSNWTVVSLPHGIETVPVETSGCTNYQGVIWYRKHFTPKSEMQDKQIFLHFEAIMGKSKIFVNGEMVNEHFGGYLPIIIDVTSMLKWNEDNVIAVWADNSDDPIYPPGKPQKDLDFTYMGGIYRDCWLVTHNLVHISNPNYEDIVAGGGLMVSYNKVSKQSAEVNLKLHVRNDSQKTFKGNANFTLKTKEGKKVATVKNKLSINKTKATEVKQSFTLNNPRLWSPEQPNLYYLDVTITDSRGTIIDGYTQRIGVRGIEFKATKGFWLNGEPYHEPLIGGNRHQDYALVGNAVSNNAHWRDAKKMRDAGFKLVRNAHYPQDPAFMDACDELGLFLIENTPGWQFWNDEPIFEQRVYQDIRNIIRRDRNHASVWLWEPILNETWYSADFAANTKKIVEEEFPFPYSYSASDQQAHGNEHFDIHFTHPHLGQDLYKMGDMDSTKTYYTREWGDNVDNWSSHNSTSRVARNWGEKPMLIQAQHYSDPGFPYTSLDGLYRAWNHTRQHVGGALWHTFDHQRGYHPDPFYGGIMDNFRQPKFSYYMFKAHQTPGSVRGDEVVEPMVYIAHTMSPFSDKDVTVYSNCDEVHLRYTSDGEVHTYQRVKNTLGTPYPVITFQNIYDFRDDKRLSREKREDDIYLLAEGYIDGKKVTEHKVFPSRRPSQVMLELDNVGTSLIADGSDFVTIIASITDKNGVVKRLNNYKIVFEVEGEAELINTAETFTNPMPIQWGTAPAMIRATTNPGKITVKAHVLWEGSQMPVNASYTLHSQPSEFELIYDESTLQDKQLNRGSSLNLSDDKINVKRVNNLHTLKEVEKQQTEFGEDR